MTAEVNATGAIAVLFDGAPPIVCSTDVDCEAHSAYCTLASSVAWTIDLRGQNGSGMCTCYMHYGLQGSQCDELSINAKLFVFGYFVIGFFQLGVLGLAFFMLRNEEITPKLNSTFATFAGCCLGSLFILAFDIIELVSFLAPHTVSHLINGVRGFGSLDVVQNALTILAFLSSICSTLVVSLVWSEYASQVEKTLMTGSARVALSRYRALVFVYVTVFMLTSFVFVAINEISYAAVVGIPGCFFIFATYLYGYVRLSRIIKHFAEANDPSAPRSPMIEKLNFILASIRTTALRLSFLAIGICASFFCYFFLGDPARETPFAQPTETASFFTWLCLAPINLRVVRYLRATSPKVLRKLGMGKTPAHTKRVLSSNHSTPVAANRQLLPLAEPIPEPVLITDKGKSLIVEFGDTPPLRKRIYLLCCTGQP